MLNYMNMLQIIKIEQTNFQQESCKAYGTADKAL